MHESDYPECGREAWLALFGCWCGLFAPMGWLNTLAVLQARVSQHELASLPESTTGWIFSTYAFLMFFCGAQVGSIGVVVTSMLLSKCTEFSHFFLTFGILGGISSSLLFNPSISAINHWFSKRRALASGVICTAGGIGGIVFPVILVCAEPHIGWAWAVRVVGLLCAVSSLFACLFITKRLPNNKHAGVNIDLGAILTDLKFALVTLAVFMSEFAVFIPYTYMSSYAIHAGFTTQQAFLLNALVNVGAIPGRALPGFLADRLGAFNILGATTSVCAVLILAMWCTSASHTAVIVFAILFGFWSGATIGLTAVCISRVCDIQDVGKRTGTAYCVASIGLLVGAPIAGAIIRCNDGAYQGVTALSGSLYITATVALFLTKGVAAGWSPRIIF